MATVERNETAGSAPHWEGIAAIVIEKVSERLATTESVTLALKSEVGG